MQQNFPDDRLLSRAEVHTHFGLTQRFLEVAAVIGALHTFLVRPKNLRIRDVSKKNWKAVPS